MDANFYKILRKKNSIEDNVFHLIFRVLINEKIKIKNVLNTLVCVSISIAISIMLGKSKDTMSVFTNLLADSFTFSVGITSFLIAACTIFFTMIKSETSYAFLLMDDSESRQCKFKTILYNFIKPILYFIFLIVYNFIFKISYKLISQIKINGRFYLILKCISIYILIYFLIKSFIELLYLVYNIYSFVLMINLENVGIKELNANGVVYDKYIEELEKNLYEKYRKRGRRRK